MAQTQSIMQYNLPNLSVANGMEQTEARMTEMRRNLDRQESDLARKQKEMRDRRNQLVLADYLKAVQEVHNINIGDAYYYNGYSVALREVTGSISEDQDECHDSDWLALPDKVKPGYSERSSYSQRKVRYAYYLSSVAKIGGRGFYITKDSIWRDSGVSYSHDDCTAALPPRSEYPIGSHLPLRGNISSALQGAKIKLAENDRDYGIRWEYAAPDDSRTKSGIPVKSLVIEMPTSMCSDLRAVANHTNQYNKLLAVFQKRDWLESYSYDIVKFPDETPGGSPHQYAGQVKTRRITFVFKMIIPKTKEEAANE